MLENCPNITSVNFSGCDGIIVGWLGRPNEKVSEGIYGMLFCECSFVFGVPVRDSPRNFFYQNRARIFSKCLQNLEKFPGISSSHSNSLAHSHLPCLLVNPIPIRRHPSARKLQAVDGRRLLQLQENHRWVLLRGTFFPQVADQSAPGVPE